MGDELIPADDDPTAEAFKHRVLEKLLADAGGAVPPTDESVVAVDANDEGGPDDVAPRPLPTGPRLVQPKGPGVGEMGAALVPFTCEKCGVLDYVHPLLKEVYDVRRLHCLPCQSPHLFQWKRDAETSERLLYPIPFSRQRPAVAQLGETERRELELRHGELIDLRSRRDYLRECIATMQTELATVEPRLEELRLVIVPAAQAALEVIETDPQKELKQRASDLARDLTNAMRALAAANAPPVNKKTPVVNQTVPAVEGYIMCNCVACQEQAARGEARHHKKEESK